MKNFQIYYRGRAIGQVKAKTEKMANKKAANLWTTNGEYALVLVDDSSSYEDHRAALAASENKIA